LDVTNAHNLKCYLTIAAGEDNKVDPLANLREQAKTVV